MRHSFKILVCVSLIVNFQLSIFNSASAQTLSLDSCLALARRNNAEIRISQMDIENAREVKKQVFTKYFPQANLAALGYWAVNPIVHFGLEDIQSNDMRELLEALYNEVSVSSAVFSNITGMAATNCFGVKGMAYRSMTDGLVHLLRREAMNKGVKIDYPGDNAISIELHIVVENGVNIPAVCRSIMNEVRYIVAKNTGVEVRTVDVYVDSMTL